MALVSCVECGAHISDAAPSCPRCGITAAAAQERVARATAFAVQRRASVAPAPRPTPRRPIPNWVGVLSIFAFAAALMVVIAYFATNEDRTIARHQHEYLLEHCPDLTSFAACDKRMAATRGADAEKVAAEENKQLEANARARAEIAERAKKWRAELQAATPSEREARMRECVARADCKQPDVDAIVATAADEKERGHLRAVSFAVSAAQIAQGATDGDLSATAIGAVAVIVKQNGVAVLDAMEKVGAGEARKDTAGSRGKVVRVSGTVVGIEKAGELFVGTLSTDQGGAVYFMTPLDTAGIVAGTWAAYRGVMIQEYDYANVANGQTRSLLLVGAFNK